MVEKEKIAGSYIPQDERREEVAGDKRSPQVAAECDD